MRATGLSVLLCALGSASVPVHAAPPSCAGSEGVGFICGMERPEDLARIPGTPWLIASGFSNGAGLKLVDTESKQMRSWYTGEHKQLAHDRKSFAACSIPPDPRIFNTQGISLRFKGNGRYTLYVVNHGGRESIEIFSVEARSGEPALQWTGCVLMPEGMAANSVASYSDGTILATVLTRPGTIITDFVLGKVTGAVYESKPGDQSFQLIPGSELPGNNGIETAPDDSAFYVVAFGWRAVVVFPREGGAAVRKAIAPGFMPDNIHWDGGRLLTAGMLFDEPACGGRRKIVAGKADDMRCHRGYVVAELDPRSGEFTTVAYDSPHHQFNGVSAAVVVGEDLWLASYQADRIAYRPLIHPERSRFPNTGDAVELDTGKVAGILLPGGVRAYRGVPFAAPPVRDLRWREPQPVEKWQGVFNADRPAPECIQSLRAHDINHYFGEEATSEDCLYLNVWVPKDATRGSRKPVVVWIHGGGFTIGSPNMANYSGESLARKAVVYVSIAYRLGALGFLAHPALTAQSAHGSSGNFGLLDQIAALRWVQQNIAQFGGDPHNVTIMGQSAGSMSVSILQASPLARGLFARAIGMSGAAIGSGIGQPQTRQAAEEAGARFQARLKAADLTAMRNLPADRILQTQLATSERYGPVVDGYLLPASPAEIFAVGQQSDVPLLVGFTRDESFGDLGRVQSLAQYKQALTSQYGEQAGQVMSLYPAQDDEEAQRAAATLARDSTVALQMRSWAQAQLATGKSPVYAYFFTRVHPYVPGVHFSDHDPRLVGAYHTGDLPYWLGTLDSLNLLRTTREWLPVDRQLSEAMSNAIVAFVRTGNPHVQPAKRWPRYAAQREEVLEFGEASRVVSWPNREKLDALFAAGTGVRASDGARSRD